MTTAFTWSTVSWCWRDPHARLAMNIGSLRRYVQAHRLRTPDLRLAEGPYDGIAEIWFADLATALAHPDDPQYHEHLVPDEPNFVDVPNLRFVITEETIVRGGPAFERDADVLKVVLMVRRRLGLDAAQFGDDIVAALDADQAQRLGAIRCEIASAVQMLDDSTSSPRGRRIDRHCGSRQRRDGEDHSAVRTTKISPNAVRAC